MSIGFGERGDEIPVEISIQVDETARGYGIAIDRGAEEKVAASVRSSINKGVVDAKKAAGVK